jgi:multiple sugar transport system substrate-binding protein
LLLSSKNQLTHKLSIFICLIGLMFSLATCQTNGPVPDSTPARTAATVTPTIAQKTVTAPTRTPTTAPTPASTLGIDPQKLDSITVTFWHVWNELPGSAIQSLVADFNAQNEWGIRVNSRYTGTFDEQYASVLAALDTSEQPDIVVGYIYQALGWDTNDQVVDLNPYVNDPTWGIGSASDDFFTAFWEADVVEGKRLGIPAMRTGQYLFYNQTWAEELGFSTAPSTPTQFRQQACAAAEANQQDDLGENNGTGGYILNTDYSVILAWIGGFGGDVVAPVNSGYQFDTQPVQNTFRYLRDLFDRGCAWLPEDQLPDTDFAIRRGLFASGSLLDVPEQFYTFSQTPNRDRWTLIPYPSDQGTPAVDVYGPSFGVLKSSPERELASWLFIRWLAEPENQIRLTTATSSLPLRAEAQQLMEANPLSPQWQAAVNAIQYARSEPAFRSWSNVRWAVSDAATQLFRYYFTIDQIPTLIELLDNTAKEIHNQ